MLNKSHNSSPTAATKAPTQSIWSRAITANSEWEDKVRTKIKFDRFASVADNIRCLFRDKQDEFLDTIYWARQVLGILIGIVWGVLFMKGFVALAL